LFDRRHILGCANQFDNLACRIQDGMADNASTAFNIRDKK
jgi:hypothetical protein